MSANHGGVGHLQHHRMRQPAHDAHVLERHVGAAVVAGAHPGVGGDHLDVVALIIQRHEQLIETAAAGEGGKGMHERHPAGERQPGGDADHIGLHDAAVDHVLRVILVYAVHRHRAHQIRLQRDDRRARLNLPTHRAGVDFAHFDGVVFQLRHYVKHGRPPVRRWLFRFPAARPASGAGGESSTGFPDRPRPAL